MMKKTVSIICLVILLLGVGATRVTASDYCIFDTLKKGEAKGWFVGPDDELMICYYKTDTKKATFKWQDTAARFFWITGNSLSTAMTIYFCPKNSQSHTIIHTASVDFSAQKLSLSSRGTYMFYIKAYKSSIFEGFKDKQAGAVVLEIY